MQFSESFHKLPAKSKVAEQTEYFRGPLFIIGMPRSGTKLLRGLLNGHSRVAIPSCETESWEP